MRILIVNTSERTGGAAVAANRLMEALNNNGENVGARQGNRLHYRGFAATTVLSTVAFSVGTLVHLLASAFLKTTSLRHRHCQHRRRHHPIARVSGGRRRSSIVGEPGYALPPRPQKDSSKRQTCSLDNARPLACHRHLPSHAGLQPL